MPLYERSDLCRDMKRCEEVGLRVMHKFSGDLSDKDDVS